MASSDFDPAKVTQVVTPTDLGNAVRLMTPPNDRARAEQYRAELEPMLKRIAEIMTDAEFAGFAINFNFGRNQYGRPIPNLDILKRL